VIGRITGVAIERGIDGCCVLDVSGVGYEVFVPLRTISRLPAPPEAVTLQIHTHVREDMLRLYGFADALDRLAFRVMLGVSGVGPKLALAILNDLSAAEVSAAVAASDKKRFASVAGIGKKMADRLVLELKDKLPALPAGGTVAITSAASPPNGVASEVASALVGLGFSRVQAEAAVAKVMSDNGTAPALRGGASSEDPRPIETLIRQALATLA
jgi:Holliday junction DNA helicase RuvA